MQGECGSTNPKLAENMFSNFFELLSDCLASYATETVMQYCHGRRKCSLTADQKTFGKPCLKESRMYLKVVYTCGKFHARIQDFWKIPMKCFVSLLLTQKISQKLQKH